MSHDGWTDEEIESAIAADGAGPSKSSPEAQDGPGTTQEPFFTDTAAKPETVQDAAPKREKQQRDAKGKKAQVRMATALGGFKDQIAQMLPLLYTGFIQAKLGWSGRLDPKIGDSLAELWGAYLDLLGFDVEASEPIKFKIGGKKLLFLFPLLMMPITFFAMADKVKIPPKKKPGPEMVPPVTPFPSAETKAEGEAAAAESPAEEGEAE